MPSPEWQLAQDRVTKARQRGQLTDAEAQSCLGAATPVDAMRRLRSYQLTLLAHLTNAPTPPPLVSLTPNPTEMNLNTLLNAVKLPVAAALGVALAVPTVDYHLTGGFGPVTYVVESLFGLLVLGVVIVGAVNSATKQQ